MWQFAIGIYFISLNPTNLQGVAVNGIAMNLAVIFLGTAIGDWIDRTPRLRGRPVLSYTEDLTGIFLLALRTALYFQNLSVALMAILVVFALYNQNSLPSYSIIIIQGKSISSVFCHSSSP